MSFITNQLRGPGRLHGDRITAMRCRTAGLRGNYVVIARKRAKVWGFHNFVHLYYLILYGRHSSIKILTYIYGQGSDTLCLVFVGKQCTLYQTKCKIVYYNYVK